MQRMVITFRKWSNYPSEDGTYTITYGEAVDLGYCRRAFHRHEGNFNVTLDDGTEANVSGETGRNF